MPTDEMLDAGEANKGAHKVVNGDEILNFFVPGANGALSLAPPVGTVRTGSSDEGFHAKARPAVGSVADIHWHDNARADGFVDNPRDPVSRGYGDTYSLRQNRPVGTVFNDEVGWHGLEDGRLVFKFPTGTMSEKQIRQMQRNLDREQKKFYTKK